MRAVGCGGVSGKVPCDIITHRGQAGFQGTAAAVWGMVSDWSRGAHSAPAAHLWPGSWLTSRWAWRGCNSKNDVRSLLLRCYSWIHCDRC